MTSFVINDNVYAVHYIVVFHSNELPYTFAVNVKERQDKLPTMYWLPKLHKKRIKLGLLKTLAVVQLQNFLNY